MSPRPLQRAIPAASNATSDHSTMRRGRRRGTTILELVATCILLGVVFSVSVPLLTVVSRERHAAEQRQFGLQHAANLLERTVARGWSRLTVGPQEIAAAESDLEFLLPGLERRVEVMSLSDDLNAKLVTVSIHWKSRAGQPIAPVRLSAWVYPKQEMPQ